MLLFTTTALLLPFLAHGYALYPRDLSTEASRALSAAGIDLSKPHVRPRQKVTHVLAVGDSYTAGIGSNKKEDDMTHSLECSRYKQAWPVQLIGKDDWHSLNDNTKPELTFGACSGNVMRDLRDKQLKQGEPSDRDREQVPIGHPQIAALTIGGNDVLFTEVLNDCVFRWPSGDRDNMRSCDQRIEEVQAKIKSPDFKKELMETYAAVIKAGREANGADPPEAFQAFVGVYVGLFNHDDHGCDDVWWNILWWLGKPQYLTTDLRRKINSLIDDANAVIKSAANELESFGVFLVDGYNDAFNGRRFCEPINHDAHDNSYQDRNRETAFWSYRSRWGAQDDGGPDGEGPPVPKLSLDAPWDLYEEVVNVLIPDENERKKLNNEVKPWDLRPELQNYSSAVSAIHAMAKDGNEAAQGWHDPLNRMFHPKGSAYRAFADKFMEVIVSKRDKAPPKIIQVSKSKALSIVLEEYWTEAPGTYHQWVLYETGIGKVAVCGSNSAKKVLESGKDFSADIHNPPWAGGVIKVKAYGEDCEYKCDGKNPGALFCPSLKEAVICKEDSARTSGKSATQKCGDSFVGRLQHPVAYCEW